MRNIIKILLAILIIAIAYELKPVAPPATPPVEIVEPQKKRAVNKKKSTTKHKGNLTKFLHAIGKMESGNRYDIVSEHNMFGRFQFSRTTLRGYNVNEFEFLSNPALQDSIMIQYLKDNKKNLRKYIKQYANKWVNNIYITESGILAAAHLVGPGGVRTFFDPVNHNYLTVDANGATAGMYMKKFGNYKLDGL